MTGFNAWLEILLLLRLKITRKILSQNYHAIFLTLQKENLGKSANKNWKKKPPNNGKTTKHNSM